MTQSPFVPCVWLDDQAESAAAFYVAAFPGSRRVATSRYPTDADNHGGKPRGSVVTEEVELAGQRFTLLNGGPIFRPNPSVSFFVQEAEVEAARGVFDALAAGGQVLMPFGAWPWSPGYGWVQDRFGVSWQVIAGPRPAGVARIVPCLMFANDVQGRAAEAMQRLVDLFPGSSVDSVERYAEAEGPTGFVKHARFTVAGQELVVMDSHVAHAFGFGEGLSIQVMCADQAEIDRLWAALADGGSTSVCGWLKDRFGFHWQIVPAALGGWLASADAGTKNRVFAAMMGMTKPEVAGLERAWRG